MWITAAEWDTLGWVVWGRGGRDPRPEFLESPWIDTMRHPGFDPGPVLLVALTVILTPFVVTAAIVWQVSRGTRHLGRGERVGLLLVTTVTSFAVIAIALCIAVASFFSTR